MLSRPSTASLVAILLVLLLAASAISVWMRQGSSSQIWTQQPPDGFQASSNEIEWPKVFHVNHAQAENAAAMLEKAVYVRLNEAQVRDFLGELPSTDSATRFFLIRAVRFRSPEGEYQLFKRDNALRIHFAFNASKSTSIQNEPVIIQLAFEPQKIYPTVGISLSKSRITEPSRP